MVDDSGLSIILSKGRGFNKKALETLAYQGLEFPRVYLSKGGDFNGRHKRI